MGKLEGKLALVTGASRGIGKAIAELLAANGARVVCTARTQVEGSHPLEGSLDTTVKGIRDAGGDAVGVACDVSEFDNIDACIDEVRAKYGPLDVLVNNAALTYFIPVAEFPTSKWMRSLNVNFNAPFYLCKRALEDMIPRRSGAIVNISSGAAIGPGRGPYPDPAQRGRGGTLYGAEKAALERFTQGLAAEVYEYGICVTCVSPSQVVPTPGTVHHRLVRGMDDPRGEPPELMAKAVLLLASEPLDKVTGRVTYSQQILKEFGWIDAAQGTGVSGRGGSGYSKI
jgi:NAD(P)-dependent dehydrogenase (short-subunit alcohol dehydrogenase family)